MPRAPAHLPPPPLHNPTNPLPLAGAQALVKLQAPAANELGFARELAVREIGGTKCLVLQQDSAMGSISTIVLRGSTDQVRRGRAPPRCAAPRRVQALAVLAGLASLAAALLSSLPCLQNTR